MELAHRILTGIAMTAALCSHRELFDKIQKKDVRCLKLFLVLAVVSNIAIFNLSLVVPKYMSEFLKAFATMGIMFAILKRITITSAIKRYLVVQLLERHEQRYHKLSYQYNQTDFNWRNTKKINRVLKHTLKRCSAHLLTEQTDLMVSVKRDSKNGIHIAVGIKYLGKMLHPQEFRMMLAEIEQYYRMPRNTEIHVIIME